MFQYLTSIYRQLLLLKIVDCIVISIITTITVYLIQCFWRRRKLYQRTKSWPGPPSWPLLGSALSFMGHPFDVFRTITEMFDKYPGFFHIWFGTDLYCLISEPKYLKVLLTNEHALQKGHEYKMAEIALGDGLLISSVGKWKKHRRLIQPIFYVNRINNIFGTVTEKNNILVEVMKSYAGKGQINIINILNKWAFDISCEITTGVNIHAQTTNHQFMQKLDRGLELLTIRVFNIFLHSELVYFNLPTGKEMIAISQYLRNFVKKIMSERKSQIAENYKNEENNTKFCTIMDFLIQISDKKNDLLTDQELVDETLTLILTGADSMATTLSFIFMVLSFNPNIQEKAYQEILEVVGLERDVQLSDISNLKYLERVIKETLRLFPVGTFLLRTTSEDIDLGDYLIPKGVTLIISPFATHRSKRYWPDPLKFDPDRFLPEEVKKRHPCAFIPFSYGPRNCIAQKYAMIVLKASLATVLRRYRFHSTYKKVEDIRLQANILLRAHDGFNVGFDLRTPN